MTEIKQAKQKVWEAYIQQSSTDFLTFLGGLVVPTKTEPALFTTVKAPHQVEAFELLAPSLQAIQKGTQPPRRRFWIERTKKASKDTDLAACVIWLLAFAKRPLLIQAGAADKDQAAIIKRRIEEFLYYNPWLKQLITVQSYKVFSTNEMAVFEILAADIAGSHGETPDVLICNELSHITKFEFIENLLDNADGVPNGLVIIATNAGYKGTQAERLRKNAQTSEDWTMHVFSEPAPWHSKEFIRDAERRATSKGRFLRLWHGKWQSGKGDAFDETLIDRCFKEHLKPITEPENGYAYVAGLDLGVSHDHAGLAILGVHLRERKIRLATAKAFRPKRTTKEIDLQEVEDATYRAFQTFKLTWIGYDPFQAKHMAQRLTRKGAPMREVTFTGNNLTLMATTLMNTLREGTFESYIDERIRRDLGKFNIVERSYGYKLESTRDEYGHADVGTALAIALLRANELIELNRLRADDELDVADYETIEPEDLPDELREIVALYEEYRITHNDD